MNFLAVIGRVVLAFFATVGRISLFAAQGLSHTVRPPFFPRLIVRQMIEIGYYSLPVVGLTAIFTGMVLALQTYTGFSRFSAESAIPNVVVLSITRELGPVLAGLMVAGRVGAAMAAELGTMRVTEQIDALTTLSTNPFKYLIAPRLIAGLAMMPILVLVADIIGVMGGYLVSVHLLDFNATGYLRNTWNFLEPLDVISGLVKAPCRPTRRRCHRTPGPLAAPLPPDRPATAHARRARQPIACHRDRLPAAQSRIRP